MCVVDCFFLNGGKIQDDRHLCKAEQYIAIISPQKRNRFMILVSTVMFSDIPEYLMCPGRTLDIALWVNSKMASICTMSNYTLIYSFLTEYRPIHDFVVDHSVFKVCSTQSMSEYCFASFSALSWQYRNGRKPEVGTMLYSYLMQVFPKCPNVVLVITLYPSQLH